MHIKFSLQLRPLAAKKTLVFWFPLQILPLAAKIIDFQVCPSNSASGGKRSLVFQTKRRSFAKRKGFSLMLLCKSFDGVYFYGVFHRINQMIVSRM